VYWIVDDVVMAKVAAILGIGHRFKKHRTLSAMIELILEQGVDK